VTWPEVFLRVAPLMGLLVLYGFIAWCVVGKR